MKPAYLDILKLTKKKPIWYDRFGVPRFCPVPTDIDKDLIVRIKCQSCRESFLVCLGDEIYSKPKGMNLFYGDPPYHGGCIGETMTSDLDFTSHFTRR